MTSPITVGIRVSLQNQQEAIAGVEAIGDSFTSTAGKAQRAGAQMTEALNGSAEVIGRNVEAVTSLGESEEQAAARIRSMVAASLQQNSALNDSAAATTAVADSVRRASEENARYTSSLSAATAQMASARALAQTPSTSTAESEKYIASLQREIDTFGLSRGEMARMVAAEQGLSKATQDRAAKLGTAIDAMHRDEQAAKEHAAAEDRATASADAFIKKLQDQIATQNLNTKEMLAYRAAQLGVTDSAAPLINQLKDGKGHMEGFSLSTVGARRELIVLAHELSQGNFQKFGGSLMVLGEQTGAASLLFSATGLAVAGVVAVLGLLSYAAIKGALDQKHMNDALVMTGNYAGVTSDRLNDLAHSAVEAGGSIGEAKKVATELAASGKFTGDQIGYITEATVAWEHATGRSTEAIIKDFESLTVQGYGSSARATEVVSKAALKLDDTYHFLTESVFEQIRALEKEGDAKAASALAMETFAKVTHDRSEQIIENAGSVARAWNTVKEVIGGVADAMGNVGKKSTPGTEVTRNSLRLQYFDQGIADSNERLGRTPGTMSESQEQARLKIVQDLTAAVVAKNKADAEANAQGERDRVQAEGSRAASRILQDNQKLEKKGWTELDTAIRTYGEDLAKIQASNPDSPLLAQDAVNEHMAALIKAHTPAAKTKGQDDRAKVLQDELQTAQAALAEEKRIYDARDKMLVTYHQKLGLSDDEFYAGRDAARAEYIAAEAVAFAKETSLVNAAIAQAKNPVEVAAAKQKYDQLAAAHRKFLDEMRDSAGADTVAPLVDRQSASAASEAAMNKYLGDLAEEAKKLEDSNAARQTSKAAVEQETVARLDLAIAYQKQFMADQVASGASEEEIKQAPAVLKYLEDLRAARARIADALVQQQAIQYKDKAADQAIKDWQRAGQSISTSLQEAFGKGGKAVGDMFKAYATGVSEQLRAQKELAAAKKLSDDNPQKVEDIQRAQLNGSLAQIKSYGDMTTAAQGFFEEGSRGYQAMHAASVMLHGAEVALSLVKGVNAVLTQGEGDPYSAFGRMAAMAAIVVGLGVALSGGSGGGGGQSAADVQKAQGTGSVFGDSSAKSDSLRRSIEQLTANSDDMLPINQGMLTALHNIESAMTGLTNLVVRTTGLTDGSNMGIQTGTGKAGGLTGSIEDEIINKTWLGNLMPGLVTNLVTSLFGKVTTSIVDSGLQYGGSVRGLQAGKGFDQYASVDTTKSSWFGLSKSTSNSVQVQGLNDELSKQFGLIFTNLDKSLQAAATAMGGSAEGVTKVLDSLTLESTKVSLKGLTGTELTDALNAVISKSMDEVAQAAFPELDKFREVGEGYAETVMRVASDYAKLDSILAATSSTFGATGMASISARENLISLAGGIDKLASQTNTFAENFLSKAEQLAPVQAYVTQQLAAMGLQSLDTRDKFKEYLLGLSSSGALLKTDAPITEAGQQQYVALLALADAFAKTHAATVDLTKSEQEIADERADLQNQYDQLTMTSTQLLQKQRDALDQSNRALFDQVQAAQKAADVASERKGLQDQLDQLTMSSGQLLQKQRDALAESNRALFDQINAAQAAADAIKAAQASSQAFANAIADSMKAAKDAAKAFRELNDALLLSDDSPLSGEAKYAEAKRQFETADSSHLEAAEKAFLAASKAWFGNSAGYAADFANVISRNNAEALNQDAAAQSLVDFWRNYVSNANKVDGSHANGLEYVPFNGYRAELHQGERVQTASQVVDDRKQNSEVIRLLRIQNEEARTDKVQRAAVATEQLKAMQTLSQKLDINTRAVRSAPTRSKVGA